MTTTPPSHIHTHAHCCLFWFVVVVYLFVCFEGLGMRERMVVVRILPDWSQKQIWVINMCWMSRLTG